MTIYCAYRKRFSRHSATVRQVKNAVRRLRALVNVVCSVLYISYSLKQRLIVPAWNVIRLSIGTITTIYYFVGRRCDTARRNASFVSCSTVRDEKQATTHRRLPCTTGLDLPGKECRHQMMAAKLVVSWQCGAGEIS